MKVIALISLLLITMGAADCRADRISVQISGGIEKIEASEENSVVYFSMSQLAEILGERISWETVGLEAVFAGERHRAAFFVNSPYIKIDDTVKNITYPVKLIKGALFLPAMTFLPMLDLIRPEQISWDRERRLIRVDSEWYNILDLNLSAKANGLLIEIYVSEPRDYEIYITEGNWLNVTIPGGIINSRRISTRRSNSFLRDINVIQFDASCQLSLRLKQPIGKFTHRFTPNPARIQISIPDTSAVLARNDRPGKLGPDDKINKIIIDPGHGGKDYGAIGLNKTREKDIVLDISKRLAKLIRKEKIFEVVMTREKDEEVGLEDRAKIANDSNGDIFVSIHANASVKRSARGFQVFFLAPANNDAARAAAQLENAPFLAELNSTAPADEDALTMILSDMIQTEFQTESADLAEMVDREFRRKLIKNTRARGIDQAGFVVLNRVYMPSILVEAAFLTNRQDEKQLKSKKYRQAVAEAIYAGLKRFRDKYGYNK